MKILSKVLSVGAGVVAAGLVIASVEAVGHALFQGDAAFALALVGYGFGSATGAFVAARLADRICSAAVTGLLAVLAAINLFAFPHPLWFAPTAIVVLLFGWAVGSRVGEIGRSQPGKAP